MFNSSRLILARKRRGFSGKELADLADLTAVHISRLEKGKAENVEKTTVEALSKALNFPINFFYSHDVDLPSKDNASFRSLSAMTARERDAALSAGAIGYLLSDWVCERFTLPEVDLPDLREENDAGIAARSLRSYWGLGEKPITNVIKLLELKGVKVFSLAEDTKNVDAFSCWRNGIPYIFLNTFKTAERSRFDACHELGHLVLHKHGKPQGRLAEMEADKFASHFLMPSMDLVGNISFVTSLKQLVKAKKRWGVSVAALAYRLHKSNVLSDWQYRSFCIQINKLKSEPDGLAREKSVIWEKVFRELWKDKSTKDHVANELGIPPIEIDSLVFNLIEDDVNKLALSKREPHKLSLV